MNFPKAGNGAPNGIGLTVAAYDRLQPAYSDPITGKHDDLRAMRQLVEDTLGRFATVWDENAQASVRRLVIKLPIEPYTDLFEAMTPKQMEEFEQQLTTLKEALEYAECKTTDPTDACERLQQVFGDQFPVPEKKETATTHPPAISSSGNSA